MTRYLGYPTPRLRETAGNLAAVRFRGSEQP
jgi:hypothetical protein